MMRNTCCCLFPLRAGAMVFSVMIATYSIAGAVFLFKQGMFFFFVYPEWFIYGGVALGVATGAILSIIALISRTKLFAGTVKYLWPFLIVFSLLRAVVMTLELLRGKDYINWECNNGGQLYSSDGSTNTDAGTLPSAFCTIGFNSLWAGFIIALLLDIVFQFYIAILIRRFSDRVNHYQEAQSHIWKYEMDPAARDREAKVSSDLGWSNERNAQVEPLARNSPFQR